MSTLRDALEVTLTASDVLAEDQHAALVSLCRLLADQIDEDGGDAPTRLTAAYLSALKDLSRALGDEKQKEPVGGKLAQLQSVTGKRKRPARGAA